MPEWWEDEELQDEGITAHQVGRVPEELPADWFREQCEHHERILRLQYQDEPFPPRWEWELSKLPPDNPQTLLQRWAFLKHCYRVRSEDLQQRGGPQREEARAAMRDLLFREPVEVRVSNDRTVQVTDRSYHCLYEIARHDLRRRSLQEDLTRLEGLQDRVLEKVADEEGPPRLHHRRRLQWLRGLHDQLLRELSLHRKAIYAHLMTESGAPADSLEEAPDWWDEVSPVADQMLLMAAFEAGPGRWQQTGTMPRDDRGDDWERLEDWSWLSVFASLDKETPVEAASYFDRPAYQTVARLRAGADPVPKDDSFE